MASTVLMADGTSEMGFTPLKTLIHEGHNVGIADLCSAMTRAMNLIGEDWDWNCDMAEWDFQSMTGNQPRTPRLTTIRWLAELATGVVGQIPCGVHVDRGAVAGHCRMPT